MSNIAEAIAIAREGKKSGRWDIFRGQSNAAWPLTSSLERCSREETDSAREKIHRFIDWAESTKAMAEYVTQHDAMGAIAQHYGLKTNFIDFTEDLLVAAFFACDSNDEPSKGQEATIICLDSKHFQDFWQKVMPGFGRMRGKPFCPELIHIDVSNLWRLQKQRGCFLMNPIKRIEKHYTFDKIIFPYVKDHPLLPRREEMYPSDQSELEKTLTHFFMNEKIIGFYGFIRSLDIPMRIIRTPKPSYEATSWCPSGVPSSEDWRKKDAWTVQAKEQADCTLGGIRVEVEPTVSVEGLSRIILNMFSADIIKQNRARAFEFRATDGMLFSDKCADLITCLRRMWNGMRTLPYTDLEIRLALERTIELFALSCQGKHAHEAFGPDGLHVDIGVNDDGTGAYSRGTVTPPVVVAAANPAFWEAVRQHEGVDGDSLGEALLQLPGRPWEQFTFNGLRRLMVEQLIPTQIVWRGRLEGDIGLHTLIVFSPAEVKVLGMVGCGSSNVSVIIGDDPTP